MENIKTTEMTADMTYEITDPRYNNAIVTFDEIVAFVVSNISSESEEEIVRQVNTLEERVDNNGRWSIWDDQGQIAEQMGTRVSVGDKTTRIKGVRKNGILYVNLQILINSDNSVTVACDDLRCDFDNLECCCKTVDGILERCHNRSRGNLPATVYKITDGFYGAGNYVTLDNLRKWIISNPFDCTDAEISEMMMSLSLRIDSDGHWSIWDDNGEIAEQVFDAEEILVNK